MSTEWHKMEVESVRQEGVHMRHLILSTTAPYRFVHGQYVQITAPERKPGYFAVASPPEQDRRIEFLVKEGSGIAGALYEAKAGDIFEVSEPLGPGFPSDDLKGKNVLLIGVGSGIAPLRSVLGSVLTSRSSFGKRIMLIYGARSPFHIPYRQEIARWRAQIEVYKAMSQPGDSDWSGYVGYVQHIIEGLDIPRENVMACVCGMPRMVDAVRSVLGGMGISEDDVYLNF